MPTNYQYYNKIGKLTVTVLNVESMTEEDIELYDGSTYRDTTDSNFAGRAATGFLWSEDDSILVGVADKNGPHFVQSGNANLDNPIPLDPIVGESDEVTHTPPHFWQKTRSRKVFWSGAAGTGVRLSEAWLDEIGPVVAVSSGTGGIVRQ